MKQWRRICISLLMTAVIGFGAGCGSAPGETVIYNNQVTLNGEVISTGMKDTAIEKILGDPLEGEENFELWYDGMYVSYKDNLANGIVIEDPSHPWSTGNGISLGSSYDDIIEAYGLAGLEDGIHVFDGGITLYFMKDGNDYSFYSAFDPELDRRKSLSIYFYFDEESAVQKIMLYDNNFG